MQINAVILLTKRFVGFTVNSLCFNVYLERRLLEDLALWYSCQKSGVSLTVLKTVYSVQLYNDRI